MGTLLRLKELEAMVGLKVQDEAVNIRGARGYPSDGVHSLGIMYLFYEIFPGTRPSNLYQGIIVYVCITTKLSMFTKWYLTTRENISTA
jgi:hypothetical protein